MSKYDNYRLAQTTGERRTQVQCQQLRILMEEEEEEGAGECPGPLSSADLTLIPSKTGCWGWISQSRWAALWPGPGLSTLMQYLTARWDDALYTALMFSIINLTQGSLPQSRPTLV